MEDDAGTIMSYCHLCGGGIDNIAPTLGGERSAASTWINSPLVKGTKTTDSYRVAKRMYDHVYSLRNCLDPIVSSTCNVPTDCSESGMCTERFCSSYGFCAYRPKNCDDNNVW